MTKAPNTTADPIMPAEDLLNLFLPNPFIKKPNNGKVGTSQIRLKILLINMVYGCCKCSDNFF